MKNLIYILLTLFALSSCEKIIDIDLNSSDPQIVIEGIINNENGPYTIKISQTTDYFDPQEIPMVSGALVIVTDDHGQLDTFRETDPGIYESTNLKGIEDRTYFLNVTVEDKAFSASAFMPQKARIDSLTSEEFDLGFGSGIGGDQNKVFLLSCYFQDDPSDENYYRIKISNNGKDDGGIYLVNDQFYNGEELSFVIMDMDNDIGDTVEFYLWAFDQYVYEYYETLDAVLNTNALSSSAPSNPNSNIDGALGYFSAMSTSRKIIVIE